MNLDPQQRVATETESTNALVVSGAGSGKTRVLIERISYLIENRNISPFEILSITFTRRAAQEMKERLVERIGKRAHSVTMGTMHAIALQMVTRFGEVLGLRPSSVTVYGEWEEAFLLKEVAKDLGIYKKSWKVPKGKIDQTFSDYYERGLLPGKDDPARPLFEAFLARCRENNSLTYGQLLIALEQLLPIMSQHLHYRHVLVDECQDLDLLQWEIINGLRKHFGASLFAVGDVSQSIYSFKGAAPGYLVEHRDEFDIFDLSTNYRSLPMIVHSANRLIEHNIVRLPMTMIAARV